MGHPTVHRENEKNIRDNNEPLPISDNHNIEEILTNFSEKINLYSISLKKAIVIAISSLKIVF